jgi:hypothetical protein
MRKSILAGALVSLLPASALAAVMPDHHSGMPAAFSTIPTVASEANAATALGASLTSQRFRTEPDPGQMMAGKIDSVTEQGKPRGGILVNLRSPTPTPESRFLIQPRAPSEPQAKTNDTRMASATRVHIFWFFGGR